MPKRSHHRVCSKPLQAEFRTAPHGPSRGRLVILQFSQPAYLFSNVTATHEDRDGVLLDAEEVGPIPRRMATQKRGR